MTSVSVNTSVYSTTYVATNMLLGLKQLIAASGLSAKKLMGEWDTLELGCATWLASGHLRRLVLEVYDPALPEGSDLIGRFDFDVVYDYYASGDGELWMDPDTVSWTVRKNGSYPSNCSYRVVVDNAPGRADVPGWSSTSFRSTTGFVRQTSGTAVGGGSLGAQLSYYRKG